MLYTTYRLTYATVYTMIAYLDALLLDGGPVVSFKFEVGWNEVKLLPTLAVWFMIVIARVDCPRRFIAIRRRSLIVV